MGAGWAGLARRHQDERRRASRQARCRARASWWGDIELDHEAALAWDRLWYGTRDDRARTPQGGEDE